MQAVIKTGGKQYLVGKGDKILIEKLEGEKGGDIVFNEVLLIRGDKIQIGTPLVEGAKVSGKILTQEKSKKVIISTYKRRKGYHKTKGHRQNLTRVEITDVVV